MSSVKRIIRQGQGSLVQTIYLNVKGNTKTLGVLSEGKVFLENLNFEKGFDELVGFRFSEMQKRHPNWDMSMNQDRHEDQPRYEQGGMRVWIQQYQEVCNKGFLKLHLSLHSDTAATLGQSRGCGKRARWRDWMLPPHRSGVNLGKFLNLSVAPCPHVKWG